MSPCRCANARHRLKGAGMSIEPSSNSAAAPARKPLGRVTAVTGSQATIAIDAGVPTLGDTAQVTVGRFMGIMNHGAVVIGLVTEVSEQQISSQPALYRSIARLDLIG